MRETTLADVLAQSGPLWIEPRRHPRFIAVPLTGWPINQTSRESHNDPSTTWSVYDSADPLWPEVGIFEPGGQSSDFCRRQAEALAQALNEGTDPRPAAPLASQARTARLTGS